MVNEEPQGIGCAEVVALGAAGAGVTVTFTVPAGDVQPPTVTVKEYKPALPAVTLVIDGFCSVLKTVPPGFVQLYVAPTTAGPVKFNVAPVQTGEFDKMGDGVAGIAFTATAVVPGAEVQPATVTVTE